MTDSDPREDRPPNGAEPPETSDAAPSEDHAWWRVVDVALATDNGPVYLSIDTSPVAPLSQPVGDGTPASAVPHILANHVPSAGPQSALMGDMPAPPPPEETADTPPDQTRLDEDTPASTVPEPPTTDDEPTTGTRDVPQDTVEQTAPTPTAAVTEQTPPGEAAAPPPADPDTRSLTLSETGTIGEVPATDSGSIPAEPVAEASPDGTAPDVPPEDPGTPEPSPPPAATSEGAGATGPAEADEPGPRDPSAWIPPWQAFDAEMTASPRAADAARENVATDQAEAAPLHDEAEASPLPREPRESADDTAGLRATAETTDDTEPAEPGEAAPAILAPPPPPDEPEPEPTAAEAPEAAQGPAEGVRTALAEDGARDAPQAPTGVPEEARPAAEPAPGQEGLPAPAEAATPLPPVPPEAPPAPAKVRRPRSVFDLVILVIALALVAGGITLGAMALLRHNAAAPASGMTYQDLTGRVVTVDDPLLASASYVREANPVADTGARVTIASAGLDVPLGAVTAVDGSVNPPGFTSVFWVRHTGVSLDDATLGTVYLATQSLRAPDKAPGNFLIDPAAGTVTVEAGATIQAGARTYRAISSEVIGTADLETRADLWTDDPGRLVLITRVQSPDPRRGLPATVAIIIGTLVP